MKKVAKVAILIVVVLGGGGIYAAVGDVWNAAIPLYGVNNPTHNNPNGIWSYRGQNGELMIWSPSDSRNGNNPGWVSTNSGDWEGLYGWNPDPGTPTYFLQEPNDFGGHGPGPTTSTRGPLVEWASPIDGWIQISGDVWTASFGGDASIWRWSLAQRPVGGAPGTDAVFTRGWRKQDSVTGRGLFYPNTSNFEDGVGGPLALYRQVSIGDVISYEAGHGDWGPTGQQEYEWQSPWGCPVGSTFFIEHIDANDIPKVTLTMQVVPGVVNTIFPSAGDHLYIAGSQAVINASTYIDCPAVLVFDHWEGEGITDPASASTTVTMDANRTVTAVFVDGRECNDVCHPISPTDRNNDCIINLLDFQIVANEWLDCTKPECD